MSYEVSLSVHFEDFCAELFTSLGYKYTRNEKIAIDASFIEPDFIVNNKNVKIIVEVKFYRTTQPNYSMLIHACNQLIQYGKITASNNLVLLVALSIPDQLRERIELETKVKIIDGIDIVNQIKDNESLLGRFKLLLSSITTDVFTSTRNIQNIFDEIFGSPVNKTQSKKYNLAGKLNYFSEKLDKINSGNEDFKKYEDECTDILKYLFDLNLSGWEKQLVTEDDLNRYDLVCRVNRGNEFWDLIISEFNSRYIVFEFKNYSEMIKQTQIYTTERYLFQTALRNVGIIISRNGASPNSIKASKGILRESGKLILNLTDADLKKMIKMKDHGEEPADYLFDLLDKYLLELGK